MNLRYLRIPILICCSYAVLPAFGETPSEGTSANSYGEFGGMLPHLVGTERELFRAGREAFSRAISVQGDAYIPNTEIGLGPLFNAESCATCHAFPAVGGSSPARNPQFESANRVGAQNIIPMFLSLDGPVKQARFRLDKQGNADGTVHPLFTIAGRTDAPGCDLRQEDFGTAQRNGNVSFRIPTPLYGAGLIEAIPDSEILGSAQKDLEEKKKLGIHGHPNKTLSDGSIGRFGWKAQTTSLEVFTAEAYAIEQGVTNELYPQERTEGHDTCHFNATPEDRFSPFTRRAVDGISNVTRVAYFLRFLAPPPSPATTENYTAGRRVFDEIGCDRCHTPSLATGKSSHPALSEQAVALYSDLLVHHMGSGLADGIQQSAAGPDEFRTAPLWGLSQRLFFLHDGRTRNLNEAILMHAEPLYRSSPSEARQVIDRYRALASHDKDILLAFLRAL